MLELPPMCRRGASGPQRTPVGSCVGGHSLGPRRNPGPAYVDENPGVLSSEGLALLKPGNMDLPCLDHGDFFGTEELDLIVLEFWTCGVWGKAPSYGQPL